MSEIIAPVAIITDGHWFLLQVKDQQHPYGGCGLWSLFGGKQEEGETSEQALARELKEELGCEDLPFELVQMPDVPAVDKLGNVLTWRPYVMQVPIGVGFYPRTCTEGHPLLIDGSGLKRALDMEGKPLLRGKSKGTVQELFMPGIADVFRQHFTSRT